MKIPRGRQDAHIAGMADFLCRVIWMVAPIVLQGLGMQGFDQGGTGRYRLLAAERVVGKAHQIMRAVE